MASRTRQQLLVPRSAQQSREDIYEDINIDEGESHGWTALMLAANAIIVRVLLNKGASASLANAEGSTALHVDSGSRRTPGRGEAAGEGRRRPRPCSLGTYLVYVDAKTPNATDCRTPRSTGCERRALGGAYVLIEAGANLNNCAMWAGRQRCSWRHSADAWMRLRCEGVPLLRGKRTHCWPRPIGRGQSTFRWTQEEQLEVVRELIQQVGI